MDIFLLFLALMIDYLLSHVRLSLALVTLHVPLPSSPQALALTLHPVLGSEIVDENTTSSTSNLYGNSHFTEILYIGVGGALVWCTSLVLRNI